MEVHQPSPIHAGILSKLNWSGSCTCFHNPCKLVYATSLLWPESTVLLSSSALSRSYNLPPTYFMMTPEPWWEWVWCGCSIQGWALTSYSLHIGQLRGSVLITVYCKKTLLWWGLRDALICGVKCYIHLAEWLVVGFPLGPIYPQVVDPDKTARYGFHSVKQAWYPFGNGLVIPITSRPLLHPWTSPARPVVVCRVRSWIRVMIVFLFC